MLSVIGSMAGLALGIGTMVARDIGQVRLGFKSDCAIRRLNRAVVQAVSALAPWIAATHAVSDVLDWVLWHFGSRARPVLTV